MTQRPTGRRNHVSDYVRQPQLDEFRDHVDKRFEAVVERVVDLSEGIRALSSKQDVQSQPKYGSLFGLVAIFVSMAGMAAALANNTINASSQLSQARDAGIQKQLEFFVHGSNRWTRDDDQQAQAIQRRIDEHQDDRLEEVRTRNELLHDASDDFERTVAERIARLEADSVNSQLDLRSHATWMHEATETAIRADERLKAMRNQQDSPGGTEP